MPVAANHLQDAHALVIEGNLQSRSIIVSQLRELGVGTVSQCSRLVDARRKLEVNRYDVVICEQHFERDSMSGQDLLDDLRRNQLLPFYTVFIMITAEASYAKVAEAAESALDAYLLKPHTGARLFDRIMQARERKQALQAIFTAIDAEQFDQAAALCLERFEARGSYWLYAARIGAELLLRNDEIGDAQKLFEAVIAAKTLPWARLGVARAQLEGGQPAKAVTTLESLIQDDNSYADAYDVMGRAQFELGNFQSALTTYQMATKLTPSSITRLLKHGMLAYYTGEKSEGVELLDRATRLGLDSKMFDAQALLLLAFARLDNNDQRGLARTVDQLTRLRDRSHAPARPHRLLGMAESLLALQQNNTARALDDVRRLANDALSPDFDFETACNLLALMSRLQMRLIALNEADEAVGTLALRFCTSKAMSELMACAASGGQGFPDRVRSAHSQILKMTEQAMTLSIKGDPRGTVLKLLEDGERTLNAKLIESAHQVLQRYTVRIPEFTALNERTEALRERYRTTAQHSRLGEHTGATASPGSVSLPAGYKPRSSNGLLDQVNEQTLHP